MLGVSSGLFDVPLAAFMQDRSQPEHRGAILAASNFLTFSGMLAASIGYWLLRVPTPAGEPLFTSRQIFLLCGMATFPVFIYIVFLIPQATIKFLAWLITHSIYRIRLYQRHNLPEQGGALLVPNHISWLDGLLLFATSTRPVRMLIGAEIINSSWRRRTRHDHGRYSDPKHAESGDAGDRNGSRGAEGRRAGLHLSGRGHHALGPIAGV